MRALLVLSCLLAVQLALWSKADAASAKKPLTFRLGRWPKTNLTYSKEEVKKVTDKTRPRLDSANAKNIKQPPGAGKIIRSFRSQVVGGNDATLGQFPWQVYLIVDFGSVCGGSLFLPNWVMTSGMCAGGVYDVYLGSIVRSTPSTGHVMIQSTVSHVHELFDPEFLLHDITVLKLVSDAPLGPNIGLVAMPTTDEATLTFEGTAGTLSGFGQIADSGDNSDHLMYVDVSVISNTDCALYYGDTRVIFGTICTQQTTQSACQGDGGSPFVYKNSFDTWVQLGISSFVPTAGCLAGPSGYTRVSSYLGWMGEKIGQDVSGTTPEGGGGTTTTSTTTTSESTTDSTTTTSETDTASTTSTSTATTPSTTTTTTVKSSTSKSSTIKGSTVKATKSPKTTTTSTTRRPCSSLSFETLYTSKCCEGMKEVISKKEATALCPSKTTADALTIFNKFGLNKYQQSKNKEKIDYSSKSFKNAIGKLAISVNCIFKAKGVTDFDEQQLITFYETALGSSMSELVQIIVPQCWKRVNEQNLKKEDKEPDLKLSVVAQCIQLALLDNCKKKNVENINCGKSYDNLENCSDCILDSRSTRAAVDASTWKRDPRHSYTKSQKQTIKKKP